MGNKRLLTIKEAAIALRVSEKTLRRWEKRGVLIPIRTQGLHRRYSASQITAFKKSRRKIRRQTSLQVPVDVKFPTVIKTQSEFIHLFAKKSASLFSQKPYFVQNTLTIIGIFLISLGISAGAVKINRLYQSPATSHQLPATEATLPAVLAATTFEDIKFNFNAPLILNSTITINGDTVSDLTGDGLTVIGESLTATLGTTIDSSEIVDNTISEEDLLVSNTPNNGQFLSYDASTGGFTWKTQTDNLGTNFFTDSGTTVYLTETTDELVIGGTSPLSSAKLSIDGDSDQPQLVVQGSASQTSKIFIVEQANGTDIFSIDNSGIASWTKSSSGQWIAFDDGTDQWGLYNYAGSPEGVITANTGTLAMDTQNGTLYVKTDDGDATDWVNLATGASSPFTESGGLVTLNTTTNNLNIGGASNLAKLAVDGDSDEIQLLVQGNGTQTANLVVFENSSGVDLFAFNNSGVLTLGGNGQDGSLTLYNELGATDYSVTFQASSSQSQNITFTLPPDDGTANYVLTTDGNGVLSWQSVTGIGAMNSFILSGDTGTDQTITDSNILEVSGGTNGIDTIASATDTLTLNLDTTEIGTATFGSGSGITWTFDAGATDPTIAFSSGSISIGGGQVTINTTNGDITTTGDFAVNGGDITSSGDLTITPSGGNLFFANAATINIGGNATDVLYNVIGDTVSGASLNVDSDDDLYIEGNLEVDGSIYGAGVDITAFACPDCIDFDDLEDTLDLDTALTLNQGTNTWTQNFTGTTTTGLTYNANSLTTGSAINITTSSNPASAGPVSVNQINATSTNATTATTLAVLDIGFTNNPSVAGNTEYILQIQNEVTSNTTDNAVTALLRLDNADTAATGSTVATNGLLITNSGDISGGIVNAINIDDTDVTTDIVLQNDETISNDTDGTILLTTATTSLSGDLTVQGGDITLNTAGTIIPSAAGTITIGNSSLQSLTVTTDATGDAEVVLPTGSISGTEILDSTINEVDLNATNGPTAGYILSYDASGGFTWIANNGGTGASKWSDGGTITFLTETTDSVTIGSSSELAKLAVDGDANEIQLLVQGNSTQTADLLVVENSAGTDFFVVQDLGGLTISPSSTDDVTIATDADSTVVITGLSSGSGTALCLDSSNNLVTCSAGSSSATLQSAYDNDTDGSDAIITLSSADDSIIVRNPAATAGTDSAFTFQVDNIDTGVTTANFKNLYVTEAGSFDTTAASLTNYAGYFANTSTKSAGANTLTNVGLYATATGADVNYAAIFEAGNVGIGDASPASLLTVGASDAFQINSSGNIVALGGAAHSISNSAGNLVITPAGAGNTTIGSTTATAGTTIQAGTGDITLSSQDDFIFSTVGGSEVDLTTTTSTVTDGVVDLNVDSAVTGGFEVINNSLTVNNGATAGDDFTAELISLTANDADADLFGLQIISASTANAAAGSYEALIRLDNAENTVGAVTDGILITSSSATDQDITDAIDVSHANIVNAINIGGNVILGTTADINLANFDVTGSSGDITTAGDIAVNGGDITSTGDLTLTLTGGDLILANAVTLNIGGNATDVAYNVIGDTIAGASANMTSDDDLYIEGFLEVDSGVTLSPDSTNDISIVTDADSTLNITGLSAGTGNALCLDSSNNVVTCTVGTGGISGSGTAGQIAFFDSASNITSEASGFGWDSTNNLFTITGGTGNTTQTVQTISQSAQGLSSGGLLSLSFTATSATASYTGDVAGISINRDNDTASQTLTDTGNLLDLSRTTTTNNASATTNVSGPVLNITNTVTATAGTINDSANLVAITQDADATGALLYGVTNRSSTGTTLLFEQSAGGTDILLLQDNGNLTLAGTVSATDFACTDCLDFTEFEDTLDLDAALTINQTTNTWTQNFDGTTTTGLTYNANSLTSGTGLYLSSTSTGLTGDLAKIEALGNDAGVTGNALKIGLTGASSTGTTLNITTAGSSGYALRVNDDGTYTDTTPFVINSSGNVGIGTTNPGYGLQVSGSGNQGALGVSTFILTPTIRGSVYNGVDRIVMNSAETKFQYWNGTSIQEAFRYTATGLIGIGTMGPDAKLDSLSTSGEQLRLTYTDGSVYTGFTVNSVGDLTIDATGGQVILADTDTLNIGGLTGVAYNAIANSTDAPEEAAISADNDLYIGGDMEIDGTIYGATISATDFTCTNCLDFTEFEDTLDLDAALTINQTTNTWAQSFTGTTTAGFSYTANSLTTGSALNITASSNPASAGPVSPIAFNLTNANTTTATTINGFDIGFTNNPTVAGNTEYVLQIQNEATSNTTDNALSSLLRLDNADTSTSGSTVITDAILISVSGGLTSGIVDAIDASDTNIDNALNMGANNIVGTTGNIDLTNFDVVGSTGDITSAGDLAVNGGDITSTAATLIINAGGNIDIQDALNADSITTDAGGVSIAAGQSYTGAGAVTLSSGGASGLTIDSANEAVTFATDDDLIPTLGAADADIGSAAARWDNIFATAGNFSGAVTVGDLSCTDCLDFAEFANSMSIDEATDINLGANALTIDLDSTGDFSIRDVTVDIATFADSGAITFDPTDGQAFLTNLGAGSSVQIAATAAPTADLLSVTNSGQGTVTDGVDGISLTFVTGDGTNPTNNGINLALTSGGTAATDILNGINFGLTGTSGTERGINFADNNFDTDINATTDLTIGIGGTNEIILTGTNLSPVTAEGNSLGSTTLEWEQLFLGDDNGIAFGLDQDWTLAYDETTDDRLELITSGTSGVLVQSATGTRTVFNLIGNSISTGTILQTESTSTGLTTAGDAFLGYFNWNPGSTTTASGDLFRINIGANGNVTNVFNVTDNGSSLFRVSETQIESALPHAFTAAGDVNIAYDLVFTNQTASSINSYGPLTITAGESFESNNLTLQVYNSGQIVAASASGQLKVNVEGWLEANLNHSTSSTEAVCGTSTAEGAADSILDDCTTSVNADYAEIYPTEADVTYGDIVVLGPNKITTEHKAVNEKGEVVSLGNFQMAKLTKSTSPYQENVVGIVSNNWSDFSSTGASSVPQSEHPLPVALSGRVPVNVTLESGPIRAGDLLTTSSTPGAAMKATQSGRIIGQALQDFEGPEKGQIMVFVNNSYYNKPPENAVSREEIESLLNLAQQNQELLEEAKNWNTKTTSFEEITTKNLFVTGLAAMDSLSLTNSITIGNDLALQNGNLETLTSPLNIQGSAAQPLNIMAGLVTIDTQGNVVISGNLKVLGTVEAKDLKVAQETAGNATILAGFKEITLANPNLKADSLLFVTPTSKISYPLYVKSQKDGEAVIGFDAPEGSATEDVKFNWWIVGVSQ